MSKLNRRKFLTLAGASTAAAATGVGITSAGLIAGHSTSRTFTFRAVTGLPTMLLPAYASYVVQGHVDLSKRSGTVTKTIYAGEPDEVSLIAFPGQSRIVRITDAEDLGGTFRITGVIDDRSQLLPGESSTFDILIDPYQHTAKTTFLGSDLVMTLEG